MTTPLQHKIIEFIREHLQTHEYSPSYKEIAKGVGLSPRSVSLVSRAVHALEKSGQLLFYKEGYRNLQLPPPMGFSLPILGQIAAGKPIEAIADTLTLDLAALLPQRDCFILKVKGDSMIEEGIVDGDLIICKSITRAEEGEIVVALIDGHEATLKRISYSQRGKIMLIPANPHLIPQCYAPHRVQIQGKWVGLLRLNR